MSVTQDPTPATLIALAEEYLHAANLLHGKKKRHCHLFLIARGMELALKAHCLNNGVTLKRLRNPKEFSHNLARLFDQSQKFGLGLNTTAQASIYLMNEDYVKKALEYLEPRPYYASSEKNLESGLATIIIEVEKSISGGTSTKPK